MHQKRLFFLTCAKTMSGYQSRGLSITHKIVIVGDDSQGWSVHVSLRTPTVGGITPKGFVLCLLVFINKTHVYEFFEFVSRHYLLC